MRHDDIDIRSVVDLVYRAESRRVLATLTRLLRDLDLAEDALHMASRAALEQWPTDGLPTNPFAWLVSTGRFKAIDRLRRRGLFQPLSDTELEVAVSDDPMVLDEVADDQLRLIFMCCHPGLSDDGRIALTLREVCGLTTDEIASAFLTKPSTAAQRIVRAKATIRDRGLPLELPSTRQLRERMGGVLRVIYLVFSEGYSATSGDAVVRVDLSGEAIRLARLLVSLLPASEVYGLLALMLLHDSRRRARTTPAGDIIRLEDQDRSLWDSEQITEGLIAAAQAFRSRQIGAYAIQAAIAAEHAKAAAFEDTDWDRIVTLYGMMLEAGPSPIVELNRAVAIAMRDGPDDGLQLVRGIVARGELVDYHLTYATLGDLLARSGHALEAVAEYQRALALATQEPERRFMERRIRELHDEKEATVDVSIPDDCGNSPREKFIVEFNRAFAEANVDFVLDHVSDDIVWNIVGGKEVRGRTSMRNEMESMMAGRASTMVLYSVITHGREAASNGEFHYPEGEKIAFCDVYRFTATTGNTVKSLTSYATSL